jgi:serine/threonine protein kinase
MNRSGGVAPPEAAELRQYSFVKELGRGGTAVVYLALDREARQPVAIKLLQPSLSTDEETLQRFAIEARTAALLQHPNIVGIHAVKRLRSGSLALVMQYVPGGTLKDLIRTQAPLPLRTVEKVVRDVASALAYAHRKGVVHRDVKPENVFVDVKSGSALLADFGIASTNDGITTLTLHGMAVGTPAYMAPEQIDNEGIDCRADIYSLALVAWEMLTGTTPWEGESLYGVIYKQKYEQLASPSAYRGDLPAYLCRALESALAKDPAHRFPNARAFAEAVDPPRLTRLWQRCTSMLLGFRPRGPVQISPPRPELPPPPAASAAASADDLATVRIVRPGSSAARRIECSSGSADSENATLRFVRDGRGDARKPDPDPAGPAERQHAEMVERPAPPLPQRGRSTLASRRGEGSGSTGAPRLDGSGTAPDSMPRSHPAAPPPSEGPVDGGWISALRGIVAESPFGRIIPHR